MPDPADKKLKEFNAFLSRDQFDDFFRRNYQAACLVALRYITDIDQAEDLVQDTFVVLWEKRETLQIRDDLKKYFFKTVKNNALKKVQRSKDNIIPLSSIPVELTKDEDQERFDDEELAVEICRAIDDLPAACRRIFNLAYRENLTYQQIACELNISKNTVKTQMGIAYKQLRNKLSRMILVLLRIAKHVPNC